MAILPDQATYAAQLIAAQAGHQVCRDYLQKTVPVNTSTLVIALAVDEGSEDAVLAAIAASPKVTFCGEVSRRRTPNWTPVGQEWEIRITSIGGHRMIPEVLP